MAVFKGAVLSCKVCERSFKVPQCRAKTASTCSKECADKARGSAIERKVTLACRTCGNAFRIPRCHTARRAYCSYKCRESSPETKSMKASGVGEANGNWKGGRSVSYEGYILIASPHHPFASNSYVFEHRLVMERHLRETDPTSPYLVEIKGEQFLSPAYHVHHKDETRDNNAINNLQCMTPEEHRAHHREVMRKALAFYRQHFPAG